MSSSLKLIESVSIHLDVSSAITEEQICTLVLGTSQPSKVSLGRCVLSDSSLSTLITSGIFTKLKELELQNVRGLTGIGLLNLMTTPNDLKLVRVYDCPSVSGQAVSVLLEVLNAHNLDLSFYYHEP